MPPSTAGAESPAETMVPNQLAMLVPSFDPATDSVETWTQKIEMLLVAWPRQKLDELATRLVLNCRGTAFQKLQLHRTEVLKNEEKAIKRIVELVGGTWGQVPLEQRFELVEKGLYRSQQKSDESADSYLARLDVTWTELMTKGISLEEIQSYVVLRGSKLAAEDKKRVIVESGGESSGQLSMKRVTAAIRMIGSNFFQEMTGNRRDKSLKVYDSQTFVAEDDEESFSESFMVTEDLLDDETIEILATEHQDDDASLVMQFEEAITEAIQGDADLAAYFSTYQEARRRLSEKVRTRGFWPMSKGYGKKGGKGAKGKGKASLAQRIANSHCRRCGKKGHWRAECPLVTGRSESRATSSTGTSEMAPTSYVTVDEMAPEIFDIPEFDDHVANQPGVSAMCLTCVPQNHHPNRQIKFWDKSKVSSQWVKGLPDRLKTTLRSIVKAPCHHEVGKVGFETPIDNDSIESAQTANIRSTTEDADVCFVSTGTIGVVDLGASQTVMGDQQLKEFLQNLPTSVRSKVRRSSCDIVFRFGNHQTLTSKHSLLLPLQDQWIRIAIVKGRTPFLLSSTFLRGIKAIIDVEEGTLWSKMLNRQLVIERTSKSLFMLDINQLWQEPIMAVQSTSAVGSLDPSESFPKQAPICAAENCRYPSDNHDMNEIIEATGSRSDKSRVAVNSSSALGSRCDSHQLSAACPNSKTETPRAHQPRDPSQHVEVSVRSSEGISQCSSGSSRTRGTTGCGEDDSCRTEARDDFVRHGTQRQGFPDRFRSSSTVGGLVHIPLREEHEIGSSQIHPVRGVDPRRGEQAGSLPQGQGHDEQASNRKAIESCNLMDSRGGDIRGCRVGGELRSSHGTESPRGDDLCSRGKSTTTWPNDPAGDEHVPDPRATAKDDHQGGEVSEPATADLDTSFSESGDHPSFVTEVSEFQSYHRICLGLIRKINQEYQEVLSSVSPKASRSKLTLLEIMCSDKSELTKQVELLKGSAKRFGLSEGDLSQPSDRKRLFKIIVEQDPDNIWYSPVCKPWCLWSNLNGNKSIEAFHQLVHQRTCSLWQISLAVVLYRIQVSRRKQFHMEQPGGSLMWSQPCMGEILSNTLPCKFDLCEVGRLVDPSTGLPIRKRLTVQTTSHAVHRRLNNRLCAQNHIHQRIEGQTKINGETISRSTFTENYPIHFARQIAKTILYEKPWEPPVYCLATSAEEHPTKRRRLGQKMSAGEINRRFTSVTWRTVMDEADRIAPRVGIVIQEDNELCEQVQKLCPNHEIQHLVLCRGTDRYVGPNKPLQPGVAPFRRRICIRRRMEDIVVDPEWEQWERLTFKGLRRKGVAARVSLTIFAKLKVPDAASSPSMSGDASSSSADAQRRSAENPILPEAKRLRRPAGTFENSSNPDDNREPLRSEVGPDSEISSQETPSREVIDLLAQKHGPKFLELSKEDQAWLLKLHRNLGHPSSAKLTETCRQLNCSSQILHAIPDMKCSTCVETQRPQIARPSATHSEGDFGDSISMDGITWTNAKGQQFHFYHFLDRHTTFHTAIVSPSRTTEDAIKALTRGWMLWAGPPAVLCMDAATEFTSEEFSMFMQKANIKGHVIATEGHWQNSQIERHGGILQNILEKMDVEQPIDSYEQLEIALAVATHTKNQWSRYRGYPPEMLVFGKMARVPGSVVSDTSHSAHMLAVSDQAEGVRFRSELALRELARKAFCQIDNDQVCRRALNHRSRPNRGNYEKGEWIMVWRKRGEATGNWQGPMQVIIQEGKHVIWATMGNKLFRAAPENVRPLSAVEESSRTRPEATSHSHDLSIRPRHGGAQLVDLTQNGSPNLPNPEMNTPARIGNPDPITEQNQEPFVITSEGNNSETNSGVTWNRHQLEHPRLLLN